MRYRLDLVLKPAEGALVRVIGMTERRGFRPCAIQGAAAPDDAGRWHLQLDVDSTRRRKRCACSWKKCTTASRWRSRPWTRWRPPHEPADLAG